MFKTRLTAWGATKNLKKDDWKVLAVLLDFRVKQAKPATTFIVNKRPKTHRDLKKYISSINTTETDFLRDALATVTDSGTASVTPHKYPPGCLIQTISRWLPHMLEHYVDVSKQKERCDPCSFQHIQRHFWALETQIYSTVARSIRQH